MPTLKTTTQKSESIQIGVNTGLNLPSGEAESVAGGKWEDEEERRFFEDIPDLKDYVPRSVLGVEGESDENAEEDNKEKEIKDKERVKEDLKKLEEELASLKVDNEDKAGEASANGKTQEDQKDDEDDE